MVADFSVENYYSIRSQQTLSFVPTTDKVLSDEYTVEVKPGVRLLKMGVIYGANASGKTKVLNAFETFVHTLLHYPQSKTEEIDVGAYSGGETDGLFINASHHAFRTQI